MVSLRSRISPSLVRLKLCSFFGWERVILVTSPSVEDVMSSGCMTHTSTSLPHMIIQPLAFVERRRHLLIGMLVRCQFSPDLLASAKRLES
jgi:hypothetical protein